jgi:hypothetical protein
MAKDRADADNQSWAGELLLGVCRSHWIAEGTAGRASGVVVPTIVCVVGDGAFLALAGYCQDRRRNGAMIVDARLNRAA